MIEVVYVFNGVERVRYATGQDGVYGFEMVKDNCIDVSFDDGRHYLLYSPFIEVHQEPIDLEKSLDQLDGIDF